MKYDAIQIIFSIIVSLFLNFARCEFFTAIAEMDTLLHTEEEISNTLEMYIKKEEERLEKVKWFTNQYARLHSLANKDAETFLSNPVNAYLLVKRLTSDWKETNRLIANIDSKAIIESMIKEVNFPSSEDLIGAATALLRLQDVYRLDTASIARGQIKKSFSSQELSSGDCFELGKQAYDNQDFSPASIWFQEALDRYYKEDMPMADNIEILEYLSFANYGMKKYKTAANIIEEILLLDPNHSRALSNIGVFQRYAMDFGDKEIAPENAGREMPPLEGWPEEFLHPSITYAYEKLCRGEPMKTPKEQSELYCYYTNNNNSYLLLQPIKVELLNIKPRVVMYYDIIKDKEADILKSVSLPRLTRATVNNATDGKLETANFRISKSTWLKDDAHPWIRHINQRIEDVTGLDSRAGESLHVINYGIGGFYIPHWDFAKEGDTAIPLFNVLGNRLATWIFYLSDVPAGGSTVFPNIGVEVKPVKGAAAFWYNLYRNGAGDYDTRHAACPVLVGSKWVANKWLHEYGNEFQRPCSLDPLE